MKEIICILVLSFLFGGNAHSEEVILHCKFKYGDRTSQGVKTEYRQGEIKDEYLKIDFEREKIISAPHYIGFIKPSVLFKLDELVWYDGKENHYGFFAALSRVTGKLQIIWNNFETNNRWSTEYNYSCSKGNLKF